MASFRQHPPSCLRTSKSSPVGATTKSLRASLHPPSVHYILSAQTETPLTPVIHIQYRYMQYLVRFKTSRRSPAISRICRWSKGKPVEPHSRITLADWWGTLKSVSSPCLIQILRSSVTRAGIRRIFFNSRWKCSWDLNSTAQRDVVVPVLQHCRLLLLLQLLLF